MSRFWRDGGRVCVTIVRIEGGKARCGGVEKGV